MVCDVNRELRRGHSERRFAHRSCFANTPYYSIRATFVGQQRSSDTTILNSQLQSSILQDLNHSAERWGPSASTPS